MSFNSGIMRYTEEELDNAVTVLLYAALRGEYTHPADKTPKISKTRVRGMFAKDVRVIARVMRYDGNEKQNRILKRTPRLRQIDLR